VRWNDDAVCSPAVAVQCRALGSSVSDGFLLISPNLARFDRLVPGASLDVPQGWNLKLEVSASKNPKVTSKSIETL